VSIARCVTEDGTPLRRHLVGAAFGSLLLALCSRLLMLLTSVLLARWMGAYGFGLYASAMALAVLLTVPTGLGLPTLTIRLLASYQVDQRWALMRGLLLRGNQAVFTASLFVACVAAAIIGLLGERIPPTEAMAFGLAMILIPLVALGAMRSAALRGLHHIILGQLPESVITPSIFLGLIAGWWLANDEVAAFSPQMAITARVIATGVAFLCGAILLIRRMPRTVRGVAPQYEYRHWIRSSLPLLFIAGMHIISVQTDVLMLAILRGNESAGIYFAASRGAELVAFSLVVVSMAIQPTIARLFASGDSIRMQRVATLAARASAGAALPVAMVMIFAGEPLMKVVFGEAFGRGAIALAILSGAHLINAVMGSAIVLLNMTGHERDTLKAVSVGVLVNVALNFLFIPRWDIAGAAMATGVSLVAWNALLVFQVHRRLGLVGTAFGK
jgi:O-antigen/teichoic acid export membrane protein